jgi:hypothetical protein
MLCIRGLDPYRLVGKVALFDCVSATEGCYTRQTRDLLLLEVQYRLPLLPVTTSDGTVTLVGYIIRTAAQSGYYP